MSDAVGRRNVLLANRAFRRMWVARAISFIGDGIAITALVLHLESANGTGTAVGALLLPKRFRTSSVRWQVSSPTGRISAGS